MSIELKWITLQRLLKSVAIQIQCRKVQSSELFNAYDRWAKENHQHIMSSTKFGREMVKRFNRKNIAENIIIMD